MPAGSGACASNRSTKITQDAVLPCESPALSGQSWPPPLRSGYHKSHVAECYTEVYTALLQFPSQYTSLISVVLFCSGAQDKAAGLETELASMQQSLLEARQDIAETRREAKVCLKRQKSLPHKPQSHCYLDAFHVPIDRQNGHHFAAELA